jgi:opacity protein-like surface antigen
MKRMLLAAFVLVLGAGLAAAEDWKGVSVIDTNCLEKVKSDPDKHPRSCALQCAKGGYGVLTSDGKYLKFDAAGNDKTLALLKESKKADHLRANVTGERDGDTIKVSAISLQ